jgi:glycosyltransferase involved in cell wall biosynthesis
VRIVFTSHYALPHLGGIEVAIDAVARELTKRGHDVVHVASSSLSPGANGDSRSSVPYELMRVPAANFLEERLKVPYPIFSPRLALAMRRALEAADVVHAHGFLYLSTLAAFGGVSLKSADRRPIRVLTEHVGHVEYSPELLDRSQALAIATIGRMSVRAADGLVFVNDKVRDELEGLAPGRPVARIAYGVDPERYRPAEPGEREALRAELGWDERPRVLFVGRLVGKKGVDIAIDATALAGGAFELVLVGPGELKRQLPESVHVLGAQPVERVATLYRAADAFLLPSHGEGFPLTAPEAMASGLPIFLGDDPSYLNYVDKGEPGVTLVPLDAVEIARQVRELLANEENAREAGRSALAQARRRYSWHEVTNEHEAFYAELRERRRLTADQRR